MEIEIKIVIRPEDINDFHESELRSDIMHQFQEITGYCPTKINIKERFAAKRGGVFHHKT
jgi:hypothetical protein